MLHYRVSTTTARIGENKGKQVFFAKRTQVQKLSTKSVEDLIIDKTSLSRGDVRHAITSLAEIIRWALAQGMSVDLADLGTFKVDALGKYMAKEEEVNASSVKRAGLRFYPKKEMREAVESVAITVDNPKSRVQTDSSSSPSTPSTPSTPSPQAGGQGGSGL